MNVIGQSRIVYLLALLAVILLGLTTRTGAWFVPSVIGEFGGDVLWALAAYLLIRLLAPRLSLARAVLAAVVFSFAVEFSQLYQAAWINNIRSTRAGGMLLGHGFLASDLLCYIIGISFGASVEYAAQTIVRQKR